MKEASQTENAAAAALKIAKNCRHYAMCKVDFLGCGICESGADKHYVSFYPEGRMDLYAAVAEKCIPITEKCVEIADSCNLCGKCDFQCYFINEMRPVKVMEALKGYINDYLKDGGEIVPIEGDVILYELQKIVGEFWATNDPAIRITYHHDLCPHVEYKMPAYVVMPNSNKEISSVIKLLNAYGIPYVIRGNGASSHGLVFTKGAVLDLNRMKTIEFDEKNWLVKVGPGVTSFDIQSEAHKRGYRVNTAEPPAIVCANIMTSGLLSTFSTTYGISADNFVDGEFISRDGSLFSLNESGSPNLFSYHKKGGHGAAAVCVSVSMKLHPVTDDEEGILVPFGSLEDALQFTKDCAIRHIGLAIAILGKEFFSSFLAPTKNLARVAKDTFTGKLGMNYLVLFIGDRFALRSVHDMGYPRIDQKLYKILYQGLPSFRSADWLNFLDEQSDDEPFAYLKLCKFADFAEIALDPSPSTMSLDIDPDLRPFFERLFLTPEMTDLVWLSTFRIQSARYCREYPCVAFAFYLPLDSLLIAEIQKGLHDIGEKYKLKTEFGFITPISDGKRCAFEYDYYFNHNDPRDLECIRHAASEAGALLDEYALKTGAIRQFRHIVNQGCCRSENLLYL